MSEDTEVLAEKLTRNTRLLYEQFKCENKEAAKAQNEAAKSWLQDPKNFDDIAKAFTQFIFRDGPIENVHAKNKNFPDEAMKEINIFMVNRIAGLLNYAHAGNWVQLLALVGRFKTYCNDWYHAEADTSVIDFIFYEQLRPIL